MHSLPEMILSVQDRPRAHEQAQGCVEQNGMCKRVTSTNAKDLRILYTEVGDVEDCAIHFG